MITKGKYLTIRISEADIERIKADADTAKLSLTDYVLGKLLNVPTIVPTQPTQAPQKAKSVDTNVSTKKLATHPTDYKGKVVRTKELTDENGTTITGYVENGDVVSVTKAGIEKTCASCSAKIKKGFLCKECLK